MELSIYAHWWTIHWIFFICFICSLKGMKQQTYQEKLVCHSPKNNKSLYTSQIFDLTTSLSMNHPVLCIILIIFFPGIFNVICLASLFFHHRASIDLTICRRTRWWAWHLAMISLERRLFLCGGKAGLSIKLWKEFDWNSLLSD